MSNNNWRGEDLLEQISGEIIIPNSDLNLKNLDKLELRVVRFIKKSRKTWKDKDTGSENVTEHVRILIHCYNHFSFDPEKGGYVTDPEVAGKKITINPQTKLVGGLYSIHEKLKEQGQSVYGRKISVIRKDVQTPQSRYSTWEWKDLGAAPITPEDNWQSENESSYTIEDGSSESDTVAVPSEGPEKEIERMKFITSLSLLSEMARKLREKYPRNLDQIVSVFSKRKSDLLAEKVKSLADSTESEDDYREQVKAIASESYPKEKVRAQDLLDFANAIWEKKPKKVAATAVSDEDEDDVPF